MMPHLVNAIEWLVGPSTRVYCEAGHQALEGVTVEDTVCAAARNGDVLTTYTLNQFQAPNEATFLRPLRTRQPTKWNCTSSAGASIRMAPPAGSITRRR